MAVIFNDDSVKRFCTLEEELIERINDSVTALQACFNDYFALTHYSKISKVANGIIVAYNDGFVSQLLPSLIDKWSDSESSLQIMLEHAGDEAVDNAKKECGRIVDVVKNGVKPLDELRIISTAEPDMSKADEVFSSLIDATKKLTQETEDARESFSKSISNLCEKDDLILSLKPLSSLLITTISVFAEAVNKQIDVLKENFEETLKKNRTAAEDTANSISVGIIGNSTDGGSKAKVSNCASGGVGNSELKTPYKNKLRLFANKLLRNNNGNLEVFQELTHWLFNTALDPYSRAGALPIETTMALMEIYEKFFKEYSYAILPERVNKETAEMRYKYIIYGENKDFFNDEGDAQVYISHYDNPYSYFTVANMIKRLCSQPEPKKNIECNEKYPQPAKWIKWPSQPLIYRTFFVIDDIIASMGAKPDNSESSNACNEFNEYAGEEIYEIIGESVPEINTKVSQDERVTKEKAEKFNKLLEGNAELKSESDITKENNKEYQESNELINKLEAYLKEHAEKMEQLHQKYAKDLETIISKGNKTVKPTRTVADDKKNENKSSSPCIYPVNEQIVSLIGYSVEHVKTVKKDVAERMKLQQDKTKDNIDTLLGLFGGVLSTIGAISPFATVLSVAVNATTKVDLSKSFSGFSQVIKTPRIYRFLSKKVWDDLGKYYDCRDKFIVTHTIQYQRFKLFNELPEQSLRFFPAITDFLFVRKESEMFDEDFTSDTKENLDTAFLASIYFLDNYINPQKVQNNFVLNGLWVKLTKAALLYQKYTDIKSDKQVTKITKNGMENYNWAKPDMAINEVEYLSNVPIE